MTRPRLRDWPRLLAVSAVALLVGAAVAGVARLCLEGMR